MFRKLFTVALLSIGIASPLLAVGCSSSSDTSPNALTGTQDVRPAPGTPKDQLTPQQVAHYTDQKGRFHPEWVGEPGR
jgi:hypothetical protein